MSSTSAVTASGYGGGPITKAPEWHALVVVDILCNNLTTGLFMVAALGELAAPAVFRPVARIAYPVAFVFLIADLICLVLDLGDPLRFHHMLRVFKPSSPMSLGTWCLTIYSVPMTAAAALSVAADGGTALEWGRGAAVLVGFLPALGAATYKGVLFSTTAQPGWKDARWLGGYLATSAFLLGCAGMLVLAILMGQQTAVALLQPTLGLTIVLNAVPMLLTFGAFRPVLIQKHSPRQIEVFGLLVLGGGVLAPLCLLLAGDGLLYLWGAVVPLVLASLLIRVVIVYLPHRSVSARGMAATREEKRGQFRFY